MYSYSFLLTGIMGILKSHDSRYISNDKTPYATVSLLKDSQYVASHHIS